MGEEDRGVVFLCERDLCVCVYLFKLIKGTMRYEVASCELRVHKDE